jgi:hypothetical protein
VEQQDAELGARQLLVARRTSGKFIGDRLETYSPAAPLVGGNAKRESIAGTPAKKPECIGRRRRDVGESEIGIGEPRIERAGAEQQHVPLHAGESCRVVGLTRRDDEDVARLRHRVDIAGAMGAATGLDVDDLEEAMAVGWLLNPGMRPIERRDRQPQRGGQAGVEIQ